MSLHIKIAWASIRQLTNSSTVSCSFTTKASPLYPSHIPTSSMQKVILGAGSAVAALSDPWRADMVAVNGEVTGLPALQYMHTKMAASQEGCRILSDQPRITSSLLPDLAKLPPNTLGHQYAAFMERNKISPDTRAEVTFVDDPVLAYVMTRYRETHDLTHCVLGMDTNMVGEVLVKWLEALQFRLPMCVGGAIFGPLRLKPLQRQKYQQLLPWAMHTGQGASFLLNYYYEERWGQDMGQFRGEMGITLPKVL